MFLAHGRVTRQSYVYMYRLISPLGGLALPAGDTSYMNTAQGTYLCTVPQKKGGGGGRQAGLLGW